MNIQQELDDIKHKILVLSKELTGLDRAIVAVESPDDSAMLAEIFYKKSLEFDALQARFKALLVEYNKQTLEKDNVVSFTAQKLLKTLKD